MQVIELPKEDPIMQIDKKVVAPTDNFKAVCTVGTSFPPANITWFINGKKVSHQIFHSLQVVSAELRGTISINVSFIPPYETVNVHNRTPLCA